MKQASNNKRPAPRRDDDKRLNRLANGARKSLLNRVREREALAG